MAMELHPFLESDIRPAPKWWYVMSGAGESPTMRVGHSATFVPGLHEGEHGKVFLIGGANPSQVFSEVYVFDLKTRSWDTLEAPGFRGRYEHSAFTIADQPSKLYIFGGATQEGNLNDIQCLDVTSGQWSDVETSGPAPSPRTHRSAAVVGSKVYIYSGGQSGPDPVNDRSIYCLDTTSMTWHTSTPRGDAPKPRHGHMMLACHNKIYLHGGMSGQTFYDDLHILDLERNSWTNVRKKRTNPPPRAAHDGLFHNQAIYMFGGMSGAGALDDAYKLNLETNTWSKLELEGPAPANRLDFALCAVKIDIPVVGPGGVADPSATSDPCDLTSDLTVTSVKAQEVLERELKPGSASSRESISDGGSVNEAVFALDSDPSTISQAQQLSAQLLNAACGDEDTAEGGGAVEEVDTEEVAMVMINGGMDTEGEIFDDTLVLLL